MEEKKQKQQKHRCVKCNSTFCYLRVKTGYWVCRSCGHIEENKEDNE